MRIKAIKGKKGVATEVKDATYVEAAGWGKYRWWRYLLAQLSPEPYQPFIDKLDLKQFYSLPMPKSYLYCTEDNVLPQGEGWHPRMSNRLGLFRLVQMPGSHEVMFSNLVGLAEKIIVAGRD